MARQTINRFRPIKHSFDRDAQSWCFKEGYIITEEPVSGGYRIIIKKNGITKKGEAVYKTKDEVIDKMWELFEFFYNKYGKKT